MSIAANKMFSNKYCN